MKYKIKPTEKPVGLIKKTAKKGKIRILLYICNFFVFFSHKKERKKSNGKR